MIGDKTLYEIYCKNNIIQDNNLSSTLFENIAKIFFEYIISMNVDFKTGKTSFLLYVLPNDDKISYVKSDTDESTSQNDKSIITRIETKILSKKGKHDCRTENESLSVQ